MIFFRFNVSIYIYIYMKKYLHFSRFCKLFNKHKSLFYLKFRKLKKKNI